MLDIDTLLRTDQLFDGHYRLLRPLSTDGATADVWLALDTNTIDKNADETDESSGMLVAIKIYRPKNALDIEGEQRFRDEFKVAFNCHHTNLLQPTSFSIFKEMPYLVLPYCEAGSSEQFIGNKLSNDKIWKFILDVASGLDRLHSNKPQIIHQDIKPANILIDDSGNFTITDFGISSKKTKAQEDDYYEENSGTLAYMAPERFDDNPQPMSQSDIWAFGATLCEILTGQVPFGENGGSAQLEGNAPTPALSDLPSDIKKLILSCLQKDPQKRPTAQQIMKMAQANKKRKKPFVIVLVALSLLFVALAAYLFIPKESEKEFVKKSGTESEIKAEIKNGNEAGKVEAEEEAKEEAEKEAKIEEVLSYERAEQLLSDSSSAKEGLHKLQTLADQNDYKAIFLMSRLYFDNSDSRDTMFYDMQWASMRDFCGIQPDNAKAHALLMQAFELNENDYALLYQLGYDFFSGQRRGCDRNPSYARWCFNEVERILENTSGTVADRYKEAVTERNQRLEDIMPQKPN